MAHSHSQCSTNPPLPNASYTGAGSVVRFGDLDVYAAGPSPTTAVFALLLLSDIWGFKAPKLRMIADKFAAGGDFYVAVPDMFHGDPYVVGDNRTIPAWKGIHTTAKMFSDANKFIKALKKKGIRKFGVAGFCWGGTTATKLATTDAIEAAVLLHPSDLTANNFTAVKKPIRVLAAEIDDGLPATLLKQIDQILSKNKVEHNITVFPHVRHGWTTRYNDSNSLEVKSAMAAHQAMFTWFKNHIK